MICFSRAKVPQRMKKPKGWDVFRHHPDHFHDCWTKSYRLLIGDLLVDIHMGRPEIEGPWAFLVSPMSQCVFRGFERAPD